MINNHSDIQVLAIAIAAQVKADLQASAAPGRWLTVKEAMAYAKVSLNTIKRWVDEGHIYGHKRTGKWIVDRESIDNWFLSEKY